MKPILTNVKKKVQSAILLLHQKYFYKFTFWNPFIIFTIQPNEGAIFFGWRTSYYGLCYLLNTLKTKPKHFWTQTWTTNLAIGQFIPLFEFMFVRAKYTCSHKKIETLLLWLVSFCVHLLKDYATETCPFQSPVRICTVESRKKISSAIKNDRFLNTTACCFCSLKWNSCCTTQRVCAWSHKMIGPEN